MRHGITWLKNSLLSTVISIVLATNVYSLEDSFLADCVATKAFLSDVRRGLVCFGNESFNEMEQSTARYLSRLRHRSDPSDLIGKYKASWDSEPCKLHYKPMTSRNYNCFYMKETSSINAYGLDFGEKLNGKNVQWSHVALSHSINCYKFVDKRGVDSVFISDQKSVRERVRSLIKAFNSCEYGDDSFTAHHMDGNSQEGITPFLSYFSSMLWSGLQLQEILIDQPPAFGVYDFISYGHGNVDPRFRHLSPFPDEPAIEYLVFNIIEEIKPID